MRSTASCVTSTSNFLTSCDELRFTQYNIPKSWKSPIKYTSKPNPSMPWENNGLFPTSLSLEGSWIGSICKVKQALLNNPFHTQCCRAFRLHLRPAGGDLKQIFTSLSSSSNTPRQPKDSHLDATWTQTKVRWGYLCTVGRCLHSVASAPLQNMLHIRVIR